jgi:hypothetical protein
MNNIPPAIWLQFNEDPLTCNITLDSSYNRNIKYDMNIVNQTSNFTRTIGYNKLSYSYNDAYLWSPNNAMSYLSYEVSSNLQALFNEIHANTGLSSHFVFRTSDIGRSCKLLSFANYSSNLFDISIQNSNLVVAAGAANGASMSRGIANNSWYVCDIVCMNNNNNIQLDMYLNNSLVASTTALNAYNNLYRNVDTSNLAFYVGSNASACYIQDVRLYTQPFAKSHIGLLATGETSYRQDPDIWYKFEEDPASNVTLKDSSFKAIKYDMAITPSSNNIIKKIANSYTWVGNVSISNDNAHLAYTNASNIQTLFNKIHNNTGFLSHFTFKTTDVTKQSQLIYFANATTPLYRVSFSSNNTLNVGIGTYSMSSIITSNTLYDCDVVFETDNNILKAQTYINKTLSAQINASNAYNNMYSNVSTSNLVFYIGRGAASDINDATPCTIQDFRFYTNEMSKIYSSPLLYLQSSISSNLIAPDVWYQFNENPTTCNLVNDSGTSNIGMSIITNFFHNTTHMMGWYRFDGDSTEMLQDSSGRGYHLTNNAATFDGANLKHGTGSIYFNAQYATIPTTLNPYTIWNGNGITFSTWIKLSTSSGTNASIISFVDGSGDTYSNLLRLCKNNTNNTLLFQIIKPSVNLYLNYQFMSSVLLTTDSSGNNRTLTNNGGTYSLDGATNSILLNNGNDATIPSADWSTFTDFSISGWFKTSALAEGDKLLEFKSSETQHPFAMPAGITPVAIGNSGDYYVAFTSGSHTVTFNQATACDVLIVGGGGGGGMSIGAGGGAGGLVYVQNYTLNAGTYTVTVGNGAPGQSSASTYPTVDGGNSTITLGATNIITA